MKKKWENDVSQFKRGIQKIMLIMRLTIVLTLVLTLTVSAGTYSQNTKLDLSLENATIEQVLLQIENSSKFIFIYESGTIDKSLKRTISVKRQTIDVILSELLEGTDVNYSIDDRQVLLYKKDGPLSTINQLRVPSVQAQQPKSISGKVTDASGATLPGVTVVIKGTTIGTITNSEGEFTVLAPSDAKILVFSFVGMKSQEIAISGKTAFKIEMEPEVVSVDEVIVVGYGTQKRESIASAVSTIDVKKTLESRPITGVGNALQGSSPGLQVTTTSGELGTSPTIRVRAYTGSLNGSGGNPLILLDNVEIPNLNSVNPDMIESISTLKDAAATAIYGARAAFGAILITSKKGLKDGTVLVNYSNNFSVSAPTVIPKSSRADLGLAYSLAQYRWNRTATEMNAAGVYWSDETVAKVKQWIDTYGDGDGLGREMVEGRDFDYRTGSGAYYYRPWDINKIYFKKYTPFQNHNFSVNGGTEKISYNVSAELMSQSGILKQFNDNYSRQNISAFISGKVNDWMTVRAKSMLSKTQTDYPFVYYSNVGYDAMYYLYRWQPTFPYGTYKVNGQEYEMDNSINQLKSANTNTDRYYYNQYTIGSTLNPIKGLSIDIDYTYSTAIKAIDTNGGVEYGIMNRSVTSSKKFEGVLGYLQPPGGAYDYVQRESVKEERNTFNGYATYEKVIRNHSLKLMGGSNIEGSETVSLIAKKMKIIDYDKPEINLASGDMTANSSHSWWSVAGFFGRINYGYLDKYYIELNGRYDGSSRFPSNSRWGFFPSASAAWRITEEPFAKVIQPVFSSLKLRGSWGSVGNQDVGTNRFISTMSSSLSNWLISGQYPNQVSVPGLVSPDLTWENVSTLDIGLDGSALKDKITFNFDWYQRTTSNMLSAGVAVPSSLGTNAPLRNYGELTTKGVELEVTFNHAFANGLKFSVTGQFSDYQTKITKFASATNPLISSNYEGKTIGEIWGYESDRLFQQGDFVYGADGNIVKITLPSGQVKNTYVEGIPTQYVLESSNFLFSPGDMKFKDLNHDGVIDYGTNTVSDHGDLKVIGNTQPRFEYGFRLNASWKGFDFSAFIQGVGKRSLWATGNMILPGYTATETNFAYTLDYWTTENTNAFYPRPIDYGQSAKWNYQVQTRYLLNLAYLRCKNINIGYTMPDKWMNKINISKLRLYVSGENLFEFDHLGDIQLDPEINYTSKTSIDSRSYGRSYPYVRTLSLGMQLTF
jgi:TonB-linked SusC/RagA family outer membrane protein